MPVSAAILFVGNAVSEDQPISGRFARREGLTRARAVQVLTWNGI
jgi:hypothetical protein